MAQDPTNPRRNLPSTIVDDIPTNRIRLLAAFVRAFQSPQAEAIFLDLTSDAERCNWLVEAFGSASHVQCHWRTFLARYGMPDNSSMKLDRLLKTPTDCFFSGISWDPDMLMPLEKDEGLPSLIPLEIAKEHPRADAFEIAPLPNFAAVSPDEGAAPAAEIKDSSTLISAGGARGIDAAAPVTDVRSLTALVVVAIDQLITSRQHGQDLAVLRFAGISARYIATIVISLERITDRLIQSAGRVWITHAACTRAVGFDPSAATSACSSATAQADILGLALDIAATRAFDAAVTSFRVYSHAVFGLETEESRVQSHAAWLRTCSRSANNFLSFVCDALRLLRAIRGILAYVRAVASTWTVDTRASDAKDTNDVLSQLRVKVDRLDLTRLCGHVPAFPTQSNLATLRSLDLSGSMIDDDIAAELAAALLRLEQLHELNLSGNYMSDRGATQIACSVGQMAELRVLDLSSNHIRVAGARAVAAALALSALASATRLEGLLLGGNMIAGSGVRAVAECLPLWVCLETLDLSARTVAVSVIAVTDEDLLVLINHLKHVPRLRRLGLRGIRIGDAALTDLLSKTTGLELQVDGHAPSPTHARLPAATEAPAVVPAVLPAVTAYSPCGPLPQGTVESTTNAVHEGFGAELLRPDFEDAASARRSLERPCTGCASECPASAADAATTASTSTFQTTVLASGVRSSPDAAQVRTRAVHIAMQSTHALPTPVQNPLGAEASEHLAPAASALPTADVSDDGGSDPASALRTAFVAAAPSSAMLLACAAVEISGAASMSAPVSAIMSESNEREGVGALNALRNYGNGDGVAPLIVDEGAKAAELEAPFQALSLDDRVDMEVTPLALSTAEVGRFSQAICPDAAEAAVELSAPDQVPTGVLCASSHEGEVRGTNVAVSWDAEVEEVLDSHRAEDSVASTHTTCVPALALTLDRDITETILAANATLVAYIGALRMRVNTASSTVSCPKVGLDYMFATVVIANDVDLKFATSEAERMGVDMAHVTFRVDPLLEPAGFLSPTQIKSAVDSDSPALAVFLAAEELHRCLQDVTVEFWSTPTPSYSAHPSRLQGDAAATSAESAYRAAATAATFPLLIRARVCPAEIDSANMVVGRIMEVLSSKITVDAVVGCEMPLGNPPRVGVGKIHINAPMPPCGPRSKGISAAWVSTAGGVANFNVIDESPVTATTPDLSTPSAGGSSTLSAYLASRDKVYALTAGHVWPEAIRLAPLAGCHLCSKAEHDKKCIAISDVHLHACAVPSDDGVAFGHTFEGANFSNAIPHFSHDADGVPNENRMMADIAVFSIASEIGALKQISLLDPQAFEMFGRRYIGLPAWDDYCGRVSFMGRTSPVSRDLDVVGYCEKRITVNLKGGRRVVSMINYLATAPSLSSAPCKGDSGGPVFRGGLLHSFIRAAAYRDGTSHRYYALTPAHCALQQAQSLLSDEKAFFLDATAEVDGVSCAGHCIDTASVVTEV